PASDGENSRISTRPGNPVTRRTISLRVWLVEAGRGERLQQDIQFLDSIVGAPTLILSHPSGERHELLLEPLDHASYIGWARFGEPGEWSARIVLELASGERVTINAGTLEIGDLLAPYARSNSGSSGGGTSGASNTSSPSRTGHSASQWAGPRSSAATCALRPRARPPSWWLPFSATWRVLPLP